MIESECHCWPGWGAQRGAFFITAAARSCSAPSLSASGKDAPAADALYSNAPSRPSAPLRHGAEVMPFVVSHLTARNFTDQEINTQEAVVARTVSGTQQCRPARR